MQCIFDRAWYIPQFTYMGMDTAKLRNWDPESWHAAIDLHKWVGLHLTGRIPAQGSVW